jgi:E3 ubiquitin-protein ligase HERC2
LFENENEILFSSVFDLQVAALAVLQFLTSESSRPSPPEDDEEEELPPPPSPPPPPPVETQHSLEGAGALSTQSQRPMKPKKSKSSSSSTPIPVVVQLMEMGFPRNKAEFAVNVLGLLHFILLV